MNLVPYSHSFAIATLPQSEEAALTDQAQGVHISLSSADYTFILNKIIGWFHDRGEVELIDHGISDKLGQGYIILEWTEREIDQLFIAILRDEETIVDYTVYIRDL